MILKEQKSKKVYSDGEVTEKRMLDIARAYPEDSAQDYIASQSEYTLNNTFSSVRQNILNWYPFKEDAEILEVGAGMGAITGMLCDKASHVTAIEMSDARASVIQARYPERNNLTIIKEDINVWKTDERFDYVIFVGVLEYAEVFSKNYNPFETFLKNAGNLLKDDGILLFAIENRFGLKYWAGGSEDHLQRPYVGIAGYREPKTPKTFSKKELEKMMFSVGLNNHRFYYVLPDYKFPEIICTDECPPSYMNLKKVSFTYSKNSVLNFDERDIYKDLIDNSVWDFFANSFLVEASKVRLPERHVIYVSAKGEVYKQFRVSTIIDNDKNVFKIPMHKEAESHVRRIQENCDRLNKCGVHMLESLLTNNVIESKIYTGLSAQEYFVELLEQNDLLSLYRLADLLKDNLLRSSEISDGEENIISEISETEQDSDWGVVLKQGYVDMTLYNAFYQNGDLIFYDQEWCFDNVPLNFILYYAFKSSYNRAQVKTNISLDDILLYLQIGTERVDFDKLEDYIWSKVLYRQTDFYGEDGYCNRYINSTSFENLKFDMDQLIQKGAEQEQKLLEKEQKLSEHEQRLIEQNEVLIEQNEALCKKGEEINRLQGIEQEYEAVKISRMFKICTRCWNLKKVMFPENSLRKKILKKGAKLIRGSRPVRVKNAQHNSKESIQYPTFADIQTENKDFNYITSIEECETLIFNDVDDPVVSIIIPVFNQFTYTYNCLKSILENSGSIDYEVLLADDGSEDLTTRLQEIAKNIRFIRNQKNLKFLLNCNNAAKEARGEYILFLNNDTQVQSGWLEALVRVCEEDKSAGLVGSKLIYDNGKLQEAGGIVWNDGSGWNYGRGSDPAFPQFNYLREVDYISGASILVRKCLWKEIGGFDERYVPAYYEDVDLAFEVRKLGYKVIYQPQSVVVHFEGKSNGTDLKTGLKKYQVDNNKKFRKKWETELSGHYSQGSNIFKARERNKDNKIVLFIDASIPRFDKAAYSRTVFQYINLFLKKGYIVKFLVDDFFNKEPYTSILQHMGVEVIYGSWYAQNIFEWLRENQNNINFAFLNQVNISRKYIDFLKNVENIKLIYNMGKYQDQEDLEYDIMKEVDMNYILSAIEVDKVKKVDPTIKMRLIPTFVFDKFRNIGIRDFTSCNGILCVCEYGHEQDIDSVFWFVRNVFPVIYEKIQTSLCIVGSFETDIKEDIKRYGAVVKEDGEDISSLYDKHKLVVIPLRYGMGIKYRTIEAMYYGAPVVTTSVGSEGIINQDGGIVVADDVQAFADCVVKLYNDNEKLCKMSEANQQYVRKHFSMETVWNKIKEDFL